MFFGNIETQSNRVYVTNNVSGAITTFWENGFINGNLRREYVAGENYFFPVGYSNNTTDYHLASIMNNSLTGVTYLDGKVENLVEAGNNIDSRIPMALIETGVGRLNNIHSEAVWTFTPNSVPGGGAYGVQLYEMNIAGLTDDLFVPAKRDASSTDYADWNNFDATTNIMPAGGPGRIMNAGVGYAQRTGYTDFSHHAISDVTTVLSVKEIVLTSSYDANTKDVNLVWNTKTVGNTNGKFEIMRSYDNKNFEVISTLDFNLESSFYSYVDDNYSNNKIYYRIKFIDDNDEVSSNTEVVAIKENLRYTVYPNPNNGNFTLNLSSVEGENVTYIVYDMLGKTILSNSIYVDGNGSQNIDIENVNAGVYNLVILSNSLKETIRLIVK